LIPKRFHQQLHKKRPEMAFIGQNDQIISYFTVTAAKKCLRKRDGRVRVPLGRSGVVSQECFGFISAVPTGLGTIAFPPGGGTPGCFHLSLRGSPQQLVHVFMVYVHKIWNAGVWLAAKSRQENSTMNGGYNAE
jgi:hypothetical protein